MERCSSSKACALATSALCRLPPKARALKEPEGPDWTDGVRKAFCPNVMEPLAAEDDRELPKACSPPGKDCRPPKVANAILANSGLSVLLAYTCSPPATPYGVPYIPLRATQSRIEE
jgi:hypothetical protein